MRASDRMLFRFILVLALGAGMGAFAVQPEKPKVAVRERPAPIILAAALESAPTAEEGVRVDQCSLNPRDYSDDRPIGDKSGKSPKKKRVIACG